MKKILIVVVTFFLSGNVLSIDLKPSYFYKKKDFYNGCGSGFTAPLVPEKIKSLNLDFEPACRAHDNCYSKCKEGGENYGNTVKCSKWNWSWFVRKARCDRDFTSTMMRSCIQKHPFKEAACKTIGGLYSIAVSTLGVAFFDGKQVDEMLAFLETEEGKNFNLERFEQQLIQMIQKEPSKKSQKIRLDFFAGKPKPVIDESFWHNNSTIENLQKPPVQENFWYK